MWLGQKQKTNKKPMEQGKERQREKKKECGDKCEMCSQ